MKLRRETRTLKAKAISSLRRAVSAFNSFEEDGRLTSVLLHLQHSAEMLLKAMLVQKGVPVFDKAKKTSFGFEKCVNLAIANYGLKPQEAGLLRAVDAMRDAEQHWMIVVAEDALYLHARACVTAVDDLLKRHLGDTLAAHLPARVLPVSTRAPVAFDLLVDREYTAVRELLRPGKRQRDEARGRIRALLAMESHVAESVDVSEADVDRVEKAVRADRPRQSVFPRLATLGTEVSGEGATVTVRFTKTDGAPVTFIPADDPSDAAAVREVDLQKKFYMSPTKMAEILRINTVQACRVRRRAGIDNDPKCHHTFIFGKTKHPRYSDLALARMREELMAARDPGSSGSGGLATPP